MIKIDLGKAKEIAHTHRRKAREEAFKPLDVMATVPKYAQDAEAQRQAIRERHEVLQVQIDEAQTPEQLKEVIAPLL